MTVTNWGLLAKSADDVETIEEAINRLILAHNENENSHLDVGQSLQSHKASAIIDHLASSVVADKFSGIQKIIQCNFESLDRFSVVNSGAYVYSAWPSLVVETGAVIDSSYKLFSNVLPMAILDFSRNPLFQANIYLSSIDDVYAYWYWGNTISIGGYPPLAFGFRVYLGALQAVILIDSTYYLADISGVTVTTSHTYRAIIRSADLEIDFYVDNVLKATVGYPSNPAISGNALSFFVQTKIASTKRISVNCPIIAID